MNHDFLRDESGGGIFEILTYDSSVLSALLASRTDESISGLLQSNTLGEVFPATNPATENIVRSGPLCSLSSMLF